MLVAAGKMYLLKVKLKLFELTQADQIGGGGLQKSLLNSAGGSDQRGYQNCFRFLQLILGGHGCKAGL